MPKLKSITCFVIFLLLAGCATHEKFVRQLAMAPGRNIQEVIHSWGYPDKELIAPSGRKVYQFNYNNSGTRTGYTMPSTATTTVMGDTAYTTVQPGVTVGGGSYNNWCKAWFEIDESNVIVDYKYNGNHCAMQ